MDIKGGFAKNDSKLDFEYKSIPLIQSNAKVTQSLVKLQQPPYEQTKNLYLILPLVFSMMTSL